MVKGDRRPTRCIVARVASLRRWKMRCTFSDGNYVVMAIGALIRGLTVIERYNDR